MSRFRIVSSCLTDPCYDCGGTTRRGRLLVPYGIEIYSTREIAETALVGVRQKHSIVKAHRYDVAELRDDGWPLCPVCEQDELASFARPASVNAIEGCYACGLSIASMVAALKRKDAEEMAMARIETGGE